MIENLPSTSLIDQRTVLEPDGTGFDASQLRRPTVVFAEGEYKLYYSGLGSNNRLDLGLATSTDGQNFEFHSQSQLIQTAEPSFASFRLFAKTVLFEDGQYKMWYWGNDNNNGFHPTQSRGIGYATSQDGITWDFDYPVIRVDTGSAEGFELMEVVNLDGTYIAYFRELNGAQPPENIIYYRATSLDGINFTGDTVIDMTHDSFLTAATVHNGKIIAVWQIDGEFFTAVSDDGSDFEFISKIDVTSDDVTVIHDIRVVGEVVQLWGSLNTGSPVPGGQSSFDALPVVVLDIELDAFGDLEDPATPVSTGFNMPVGPRDVMVTEEAGDEDGWNNANDFGDKLWSFNSSDFVFHIGEDWNLDGAPNAELNPPQDVYAVSLGKVIFAGPDLSANSGIDSGFGNLVILEHLLPDGRIINTLYAHLTDINVTEGQIIETEDFVIGTVGNTGSAATSHLHFELFEGDVATARAQFGYLGTPNLNAVLQDGEVVVQWFDPYEFIAGETGFEPDAPVTANGGAGAQTISGGNSADNLSGGRGQDTIFGLEGNDQIFGNRGRDTLEGNTGDDFISGGRGRDEIFGGFGDDNLSGGRGRDLLMGGNGNDQINGNRGRDTIIGGDDDDLLAGGRGADTFVFKDTPTEEGDDIILDFEVGRDVLQFDGLVLDDLTLTQNGDDTVIAFGQAILDSSHPTGFTNSITLTDINVLQLSTADFDFV